MVGMDGALELRFSLRGHGLETECTLSWHSEWEQQGAVHVIKNTIKDLVLAAHRDPAQVEKARELKLQLSGLDLLEKRIAKTLREKLPDPDAPKPHTDVEGAAGRRLKPSKALPSQRSEAVAWARAAYMAETKDDSEDESWEAPGSRLQKVFANMANREAKEDDCSEEESEEASHIKLRPVFPERKRQVPEVRGQNTDGMQGRSSKLVHGGSKSVRFASSPESSDFDGGALALPSPMTDCAASSSPLPSSSSMCSSNSEDAIDSALRAELQQLLTHFSRSVDWE